MNSPRHTPETLRESAFVLVSRCRNDLKAGRVDTSQLEGSVRAYCDCLAALPLEEGMRHRDDLRELMRLVTLLGEELAAARDEVQRELSKLERTRKAHIAYQHSEGMGKEPKEE